MLAPRRVPPCLTASVAMLNTRIKLMGPEATPVELDCAARRSQPGERKAGSAS